MISRLLPLLMLLAATPAGAQSVADYYHAAAQSYIGGQNAEAEAAAEAGLALDPTDAKLRALLEKIRERNPQDGGGEQNQDADEQEQGEGEQQDNAEGGEQEESESEGEPQDEQERQQEGRQQPGDPSQQQDEGDAGAEGEQDPASPQGGGSTATPFDVRPGEMSRAEAERILRALEADEVELLRDVQRRRARPRYVEKDW